MRAPQKTSTVFLITDFILSSLGGADERWILPRLKHRYSALTCFNKMQLKGDYQKQDKIYLVIRLCVGCSGQFLKRKKGAGGLGRNIAPPSEVAEHSQGQGEVGGHMVHHHRAEVAHEGGQECLPPCDGHPCCQSLEKFQELRRSNCWRTLQRRPIINNLH